MSRIAIWRGALRGGTLSASEEETGIYREEVIVMMGTLADITTDTRTILSILRGDDEDGDEEEEMDG